MNKNENGYLWEVFSLSDGTSYVLIRNNFGLLKTYDLFKYSIKFALDDFLKFEISVNAKKQQQ